MVLSGAWSLSVTQFSFPWKPRNEVRYGFLSRIIIAIVGAIYAIFKPVVSRFPGLVAWAVLILSCLLVWAHAVIFDYVDEAILGAAAEQHIARPVTELDSPSTWGYSPSTIEPLLTEAGMGPALAGICKYVLWPLQFIIVRDLIILAGLFALFGLIPAYAIWWERKVAGRIQSRTGPMRVGRWHGWAQSLADGLKLVLKEDLVPDAADKPLFRVAPYLALIPAGLAFVALPFGVGWVFCELDVALIFILAMLGIEVVGVIVGGWASNNKWSVYGAMREACQMVAYEIPMAMALLVPIVCAGTLSLREIGEMQSGGWFSWLAFANPFAFLAFGSYVIASLASVKRAPFDLPESESELVAGFHTEYSGYRWGIFFLAEYAAMFVVGALASVLFLGGWNSPLPSSWASSWGDGWIARIAEGILFGGPLWFIAKAFGFVYLQMWLRWTLPRIRIDQVLYACVQVLLPLTMLLLIGTTLWVWALGSSGFAAFSSVVNVILGLIGLVFAIGFLGIAGYGFYNQRRLVGRLNTDLLRGS
jgi:NADH-quinone oxidoreductase subunit H